MISRGYLSHRVCSTSLSYTSVVVYKKFVSLHCLTYFSNNIRLKEYNVTKKNIVNGVNFLDWKEKTVHVNSWKLQVPLFTIIFYENFVYVSFLSDVYISKFVYISKIRIYATKNKKRECSILDKQQVRDSQTTFDVFISKTAWLVLTKLLIFLMIR